LPRLLFVWGRAPRPSKPREARQAAGGHYNSGLAENVLGKDSRTEIVNRRRKQVAEKISLATLEAAITACYDNLSDAEVEEDRLWGEFASRELAAIYPPSDPDN